MEQLAQPGASLVQLRFRISDRKAQHRSNFIVFVSLDIVEHESLLIAGRQLSDSTLEMHSIDGARQYQVENADSPRNVWILRNTCKNASWVNSSASAVFPIMRRHKEYTRCQCWWKSASNAFSSPLWARVISSAIDGAVGVD